MLFKDVENKSHVLLLCCCWRSCQYSSKQENELRGGEEREEISGAEMSGVCGCDGWCLCPCPRNGPELPLGIAGC